MVGVVYFIIFPYDSSQSIPKYIIVSLSIFLSNNQMTAPNNSRSLKLEFIQTYYQKSNYFSVW